MRVFAYATGPLQTNCYVVAPEAKSEVDGPTKCIVIDPGYGAADWIKQLSAQEDIQPAAVVLTHGHLDHTRDVGDVRANWDVPVYINENDNFMLQNPRLSLSPALSRGFDMQNMEAVTDAITLTDGEQISAADLDIVLHHAPGHSPGCSMLQIGSILFSGDVLFKGAIGRVDVMGGDPEAMMTSLKTKVLPLKDNTVVYPGHGPETTIGTERASNPFLLGL